MQDISPKYQILTAEEEIIIPPSFQDTMGNQVGGFRANSQTLTQGKVKINGVDETLIMGDATSATAGTGIFMGKSGSVYVFRAGNPTGQYIYWDGSTLTIVGTVTATAGTIGGFDIGADYIRDSANTMGLASTVTGGDDVRFWAGASFANRATAPTRILESGSATFTNIRLKGDGNAVYLINDNGIYSFGDGSDGSATLNGTNTVSWASKSGSTYTMTRDCFMTDLTVSSGSILKPSGYRIFGTGTLTVAGTIQRDGNAGGNGADAGSGGSDGLGGTAGAALAAGYLLGSPAGKAGTDGTTIGATSGTTGESVTNSIGSSGAAGGEGGTQGVANTNGPGGTATATTRAIADNFLLATYLDMLSTGNLNIYNGSAGSGSGGGGNNNNNGGGIVKGGGGGGSGSPGGILCIFFATITVSSGGVISANGGAGGNGGASNNINYAGGGGGGGGNGGEVILFYGSYSNAGTVSANGGTGGTGGAGGGAAGVGGTNGTAGNIRSFQVAT